MSGGSLTDQAAVGARIGVAAALVGISAETMVRHIGDVASGPLVDPVAFTDADVHSFGIGTALSGDDLWLARRMASLAAGISPSKALARAAVARRGDLWIERAIGSGGSAGSGLDGVLATLAIAGTATLEDDLAVASAIGIPAAAQAALADRMRLLEPEDGARDRLVRVTVYSGPEGRDTMLELGAQLPPDALDRIRNAFSGPGGCSGAQLRLLDQVHPILAAGRPVWIRCAVTHELVPGATLAYSGNTLDNALRVVNGLSTSDGASTRFGAFVGALGADRVRFIELSIGPTDPVRARMGVAVAAV
jgi:hypothetical protein